MRRSQELTLYNIADRPDPIYPNLFSTTYKKVCVLIQNVNSGSYVNFEHSSWTLCVLVPSFAMNRYKKRLQELECSKENIIVQENRYRCMCTRQKFRKHVSRILLCREIDTDACAPDRNFVTMFLYSVIVHNCTFD